MKRTKHAYKHSRKPGLMTYFCNNCGQEKPASEFTFNKARNKYDSICRKCDNARGRKYYTNNTKKVLKRTGAYQKQHPEKRKEYSDRYFLNHPDYYKLYISKPGKKEMHAASWKLWVKNNPGKRRAGLARRRKAIRQATPPWARTGVVAEQIVSIYENRPKGHHVDHIVALKAVDPETGVHIASGLHVPWNLQYLKGKLNLSKGNKLVEV